MAQSPASTADSVRLAIEMGVERQDLAMLEGATAAADCALVASPHDALLRHYHAYAAYRIGTLVLSRDGSGKARPWFERAHDELEALAADHPIPETNALLSAAYGMQIATARVQLVAGMRLGPKANHAMEHAIETGPGNPRVWLIRGIGAYNTVKALGGGQENAEAYLKKAIALFPSDAARPPFPQWGLAESHIWLGRVFAKGGKRDAARAEYRTALQLQPHNTWITETLIPELDSR